MLVEGYRDKNGKVRHRTVLPITRSTCFGRRTQVLKRHVYRI